MSVFEANKDAILTLNEELISNLSMVHGYLDSPYLGTYRQIFMLLLVLFPLLVLYFIYFNTYKVEGGHCLGGCCMDGVEGLDRTIGWAMATFWILLLLAVPVTIGTLALADLCSYDDPVALVNSALINDRNVTVGDRAHNITAINMATIADYFSNCNGSIASPLQGLFDNAYNISEGLTASVQSVIKYNDTAFSPPPVICSPGDYACETCPNVYPCELYNLTVLATDRTALLEDTLNVQRSWHYIGIVSSPPCASPFIKHSISVSVILLVIFVSIRNLVFTVDC